MKEPHHILGGDPVQLNRRHFKSKFCAEFEYRLPEPRIVHNDQPRIAVTKPVQVFQCLRTIIQITNGIGEYDHIESFLDRCKKVGVFDVPLDKMQVRVMRSRLLNHALTQVNADSISWIEC